MSVAKPIPENFVTPEWFSARVAKRTRSGCHEWTGRMGRDGYGSVVRHGESRQAHRVALVLAGEDVPIDAVVDHLCRNRACVNPAHLDVTTSRINTLRGVSPIGGYLRAVEKGKCINGHDLGAVGFHRAGRTRTCAQCGRDRVAAYRARRHRDAGAE